MPTPEQIDDVWRTVLLAGPARSAGRNALLNLLAIEREECAKIADSRRVGKDGTYRTDCEIGNDDAAIAIAEYIRARGKL